MVGREGKWGVVGRESGREGAWKGGREGKWGGWVVGREGKWGRVGSREGGW